MARILEGAGADALELNIYYLPTNPEVTSAEVEKNVIDIATKLIDRRPDRQGDPFRIDQIPMDDPATYALLQSGETTNVSEASSPKRRCW